MPNKVSAIILPPHGFWFAPLSPETGKVDTKKVSVGEHRGIVATRNIKAWLEGNGLPYHSSHKFRHGHIQYGLAQAQSIADFKAISVNVMHASMEITDEIYSNLNDGEVQNRIGSLGKDNQYDKDSLDIENLIKEFLIWKQKNKSS